MEVLAKLRKALIVYGHLHFQRRQIMSNFDMSDWRMQTIVSLIERASPARVFTIWRFDDELAALIPELESWPLPPVRKCHCHPMRGTVLLLDRERSLLVDVDLLRVNGLIVHDCHELAEAVKQLQQLAPEVIVAVLSAYDSASIISALRGFADHATSIIVTSVPEQREAARHGGADSFLLNSAPPSDLLYEIHRALILRRSGRRLPWNW